MLLNVFQAAEIKSEVEKQMRLERAEFARQKAEDERTISDLQAECCQLTAEVEKVCIVTLNKNNNNFQFLLNWPIISRVTSS